MTHSVRDFLRLHLETLGAVVEDEEHNLHALLPADATAGGTVEEVLLAMEGPPAGAAVDARLGSRFLEQAVASRRARPLLAAVALAGELPRRLPDHLPVLLNGVRGGAVGPRTRTPARYLAAHLRARLQGDEVRHVMLDLTVRLEDGARVPPLEITRAYPITAPPLTNDEHAHAARALRTAVRRTAPTAFAGALAAIARRARRDLMRIGDYYSSLDAEMTHAVGRARSAEERARRTAKRAMLPEELDTRRRQLCERLSARLGAELVAATIIETEVDRYTIPVRRRTVGGTVTLLQRAGDGGIEGPACAGCAVAALRFHLCDERLHPLCDACGHAGRLDRARCPGCKPPRPAPLAVAVEDATATLTLGGAPREAPPDDQP